MLKIDQYLLFGIIVLFICPFGIAAGQSTSGLSSDKKLATGIVPTANYRVAMSFDGNADDRDDYVAAPLALAMMAEAGLADRVVHVSYNDNVWKDVEKMALEMEISIQGVIEKWHYNDSLFFEIRFRDNLPPTQRQFRQVAEAAYQAHERLYFIMAGRPEVPYQLITAIDDPLVRKNITVVSHSVFNEDYGCRQTKPIRLFEGAHCWEHIKASGVNTIELHDQNGYDGDNDMNSSLSAGNWSWLEEMGGKYAWLYSRNPFFQDRQKFDPSDAGMVWWLIQGRNGEGDPAHPDNPRSLPKKIAVERGYYASPAKVEALFKTGEIPQR